MKATLRGLALLFVCSILLAVPRASEPDAEEDSTPTGRSATWFEVEVPAMEAFADWPPEALRTRGYWLPWSVAAFKRARLFGRPVLFTLTVDWNRAAQILEDGALSDPEVMREVNANYVSVRVNADLRPDVRARYGTGIWPAVYLLLPTALPMLSQAQTRDLGIVEPIRTTALSSEGMQFLLKEGKTYWDLRSSLLLEVGDAWAEAKAEANKVPRGAFADEQSSDLLVRWLMGNADRVGGGFGAAPKFVVPWLDEYAALRAARGSTDLREQSRLTLEQVAGSALFDKVDGGVHRVAAAPGYGGIEYEKMLVGNTAFVRDLTYSLRGEDSTELRQALESTADFIVNVLGRPQGGFHLAQFADSASEDGGGYWRAEGPRRADPPPADPIVLSGPNALAGAALLRAGWLLEREDLRNAGTGALEAVRREAYRPGRGVIHAMEPRGSEGIFLVAVADAAFGFLEGYQLTGDAAYLDLARELVDFARANLRYPGEPVVRDRLEEREPVGLLSQPRWPMRANARLARVMRRLAVLGLGEHYGTEAQAILEALSGDLASFATAGIELGVAIEESIQEPVVVRISGASDNPQALALRRAAVTARWPWVLIANAETDGARQRPLAEVSRGEETKVVKRSAELDSTIATLTTARTEGE